MPGPQQPKQPAQPSQPWYRLGATQQNPSWMDELIGAPTAIVGGLTGLPTPDTPMKRWAMLAGAAMPFAASTQSPIEALRAAAPAEAGTMAATRGAATGSAEVLDLSQPLSDAGRAGILRASQGLPAEAQQHAQALAADAHLQMPYAQRQQTIQTLLRHDPQFLQKAGYLGWRPGASAMSLARPGGGMSPAEMQTWQNTPVSGNMWFNVGEAAPGAMPTEYSLDAMEQARRGIQLTPPPAGEYEAATPGTAMTKFRRQQAQESSLARERQQMRRGR